MAKFVFVYQGGGGMPETPADQEKVMAEWGAWFETIGAGLVDGGAPFGATQTVAADGTVGTGVAPLSGYSIVDATDLAAATAVAKGCPVLSGGGSVQVCEAIDM